MGILVAIEGIDGSGKGTQAEILRGRLERIGKKARIVSFPQYKRSFFGREVGDFLNGKFGSLTEVHPKFASLLYALDRFEFRDRLNAMLGECDFVICDRYVSSNIAHQSAKLGSAKDVRNMQRWIEQVEYTILGMPKPRLTVLLDMPSEVSHSLILRKKRRRYTAKSHDLHEADTSYLERVRRVYRQISRNRLWIRIECFEEVGTSFLGLRSERDISDEVFRVVMALRTKRPARPSPMGG
jgi:dTMP kinase